MADFPNTGTTLDAKTNTGLSTQIVIKIDGQTVGAVKSLSVDQNRGLAENVEIGTDGIIEIVPNKATTYSITVDRLVFDNARLPEAFGRAFRFIAAQRVPFDIDIYERQGPGEAVVVMTYKNCWFASYKTPYQSENYIITENATIKCETAFVVEPSDIILGRDITVTTDTQEFESTVNSGARRGSLDYGFIIDADSKELS